MRKISFVNLYSKNNHQLISFYRDVVGLKDLKGTTEHWHGFDTGQTTFAIEPLSNRDTYAFEYNKANPVLIQLRAKNTEDLEQWTRELEEKGVVMHQRMVKRNFGTISTFTDPDGNVIELLYE